MAGQIHRCGQCDEDWPAIPEFQECPGCGTPCAVVAAAKCKLDVAEARKRAKHARFNRYLNEESAEERANRQANSPLTITSFNDVIEGAGFQEWEQVSIAEAENMLSNSESGATRGPA